MSKVYITTQSYRKDVPTPYGYLLEMDSNTGKILRKCRVETPVEARFGNERIKPGLRGLCLYKEKLYTSTWNSIVIIDKDSLKPEMKISHKWMSDLHGIYVDDNGIWVSSSLPDAAILYDFDGRPKSSLWMSDTFLYEDRTVPDRKMDWSARGKTFRGFTEYHSNHVEVDTDTVYITGRGRSRRGRVIKVPKEAFLKKEFVKESDITLFTKGLYGPHDGLFKDGKYWVTETHQSTIAAINMKGKIVFRKKIKESEQEFVQYDNYLDFIYTKFKEKLLKKSGKKITHWTRGLSVGKKWIFVGQSTWAGDDKSLARIVKIDKKTMKIVNCFYIDIVDYPETRIFQILELP